MCLATAGSGFFLREHDGKNAFAMKDLVGGHLFFTFALGVPHFRQ